MFRPTVSPPAVWRSNAVFSITTLPFLLLLLLLAIFPTTITAADTRIPYSKFCNDVVPESPPSPTPLTDPVVLTFSNAQYSTGSSARQLSFRSTRAYRTQSDAVFKFDATLHLQSFRLPGKNLTRRGLRLVHVRPPKFPVDSSLSGRGPDVLSLSGFWNSSSGKLCMVGPGFEKRYSSLLGVLKLHYPDKSNIYSSFINGSVEIYSVAAGRVVERLMILGVNLRNYEFQLIGKEVEGNVFQTLDHLSNASLKLGGANEFCRLMKKSGVLELEYKEDCGSVNCDFLSLNASSVSTLPKGVFLNQVECWESGFVRYLLEFVSDGERSSLKPNVTLVAEGKWDGDKNRLDMVGCRMLDGKGSVGDCSIRLSLRLPQLYTVRERHFLDGEMWSSRQRTEVGFFGRDGLGKRISVDLLREVAVKYEYTKIEDVKQTFAGKMVNSRGKGGKFPESMSLDMRFHMMVRTEKGEVVNGYSSPLFVGDRSFTPDGVFRSAQSSTENSQSGLVNISYKLAFRPLDVLNITELPYFSRVQVFAEGLYDSRTGHVYMIGCLQVPVPYVIIGRNSSLDCEVAVEIQYPPLDGKRGDSIIKGSIESLRMKSDPLYFEPLQISSRSLYMSQAKESIWRMDLEMTLVLVSNTLACIFVGLQLFYVQKHPDMLPFISVMMLAVLTLGHMIPLLLNFEALFLSSRNRQNVYLGSDGWIEINEVLVRMITMVAFLLEFRLLQLTWSAKAKDEAEKILWVSEKKVLYLCLPLYIGGGLIAWFACLSSKPHGRTLLMITEYAQGKQTSFWGGFKSFAGLILDGFLFPQILFNMFSNRKERALAPAFYLGTSLVRLLPHAYDLYRSHSSAFSVHMIYGNPKTDYYSTAWDILICILGLAFVLLVFLQQKFGGRCFFPKRFRQTAIYEKLPDVGTET